MTTNASPSPGPGPAGDPQGCSRSRCQAAVRRRPWSPASERALAMLRLYPVAEAAVPRLHIEPARADGALRVYDRPTGQRVLVYTPRLNAQFRAGHRAGRWYVRPAGDLGDEPRGPGFGTARAALDAVAAGRWSFATLLAERRRPRVRVIWPA